MEAAKIDGASYSQTVRYVTLPLIETHAIGLRNIVRIGMYETF